jgi:class 3 adenylate cyclase
MGVVPQGFPVQLEEEWKNWFHENTICKKLDSRLLRQAVVLGVVSILESFTFISPGRQQSTHRLFGSKAMSVHLTCRFFAVAIIVGWRVAHLQGVTSRRPHAVQLGLFISYCIIACLLFISYDALIPEFDELKQLSCIYSLPRDERQQIIMGNINDNEECKLHNVTPAALKFGADATIQLLDTMGPPKVSVSGSVLFLSYMILTTQHQLQFSYMCGFVILTMILMFFAGGDKYLLGSRDQADALVSFNFGKGDLMLFICSSACFAAVQHRADYQSRQRCMVRSTLKVTTARIDRILSSLMPEIVVEEIRKAPSGAPPPSHQYSEATIVQSDLVGFTKLASTKKPDEVVEFVSELFGTFDRLCDKYMVYKVETIGDAYIAGQGVVQMVVDGKMELTSTLTKTYDPTSVLMLAVNMIKETQIWSSRIGEDVNCRVGAHTGSCIGGMVGKEMQRYHLFGHFMSCLEGLESTAPKGQVQVSNACKKVLDELVERGEFLKEYEFEGVKLVEREGELTTSKGELVPPEDVGGVPTYVVGFDEEKRNTTRRTFIHDKRATQKHYTGALPPANWGRSEAPRGSRKVGDSRLSQA